MWDDTCQWVIAALAADQVTLSCMIVFLSKLNKICHYIKSNIHSVGEVRDYWVLTLIKWLLVFLASIKSVNVW